MFELSTLTTFIFYFIWNDVTVNWSTRKTRRLIHIYFMYVSRESQKETEASLHMHELLRNFRVVVGIFFFDVNSLELMNE